MCFCLVTKPFEILLLALITERAKEVWMFMINLCSRAGLRGCSPFGNTCSFSLFPPVPVSKGCFPDFSPSILTTSVSFLSLHTVCQKRSQPIRGAWLCSAVGWLELAGMGSAWHKAGLASPHRAPLHPLLMLEPGHAIHIHTHKVILKDSGRVSCLHFS